MDHLVTERQAPDSRGELVMKKKWFVIMMLLVSLLAAGCGRDKMPARTEQSTEPSTQTQRQLPLETMADRKRLGQKSHRRRQNPHHWLCDRKASWTVLSNTLTFFLPRVYCTTWRTI